MSGQRPTLWPSLNAPAGRARLLAGLATVGLFLALLLSACGGGGDGVAAPVEAEQPETEPEAAEESDAPPEASAEEEEEEDEPPAPQEQADEQDPDPERPAAAIVEVLAEDLPSGFDVIPFYADIPGLLRESDDGNLAALGLRAAVPGFSGGQGFANNDTGELIFIVTIRLETAAAAAAAVDYIGTREVVEVMQFIEPTDTLFDSERRPDPILGSGGVRYSLRYGVEDAGRRTRDVATELVVFGQDGSLIFLQRSVNVTGSELEAAGDETDVDLIALGRLVAERIVEIVRGEAAGADDR